MNATSAAASPSPQVVRGNPTDEELAAVLVVLLAAGAAGSVPAGPGADPTPAGGTSTGGQSVRNDGWADRHHGLRPALQPGPGAWQRAGRPSPG